VPPKSESAIELVYRPLAVGESSAKLTVRTQELGEFVYNLILKGLPTSSQRQIHFKTAIGTELVQVFRF